MTPLDTPPDWHERIARRAAEWAALGPAAAIAAQVAREEMSAAVATVARAVFCGEEARG